MQHLVAAVAGVAGTSVVVSSCHASTRRHVIVPCVLFRNYLLFCLLGGSLQANLTHSTNVEESEIPEFPNCLTYPKYDQERVEAKFKYFTCFE